MANPNEGRYALVTGSARGIGACIAIEMAKAGYSGIGINYNFDLESAQETVKEIEALGVKVKLYQADVAVQADCERMITQFIADFGKIDVLVNNAGGALKIPEGMIEDMPVSYIDDQIALNCKSFLYCIQLAVKDMKAKGTRGRIVNISSQMSMGGWVRRKFIPYVAGKGGVNAMTMALGNELAPFGIIINAIAPGPILTRISRRYTDEQRKLYVDHIPAGFYGEPIDIANMALFLSDVEKPRFIVGQTILIDGGFNDDGILQVD